MFSAKFQDPARNVLINTPQESPPEAFEELEDAAEEKRRLPHPYFPKQFRERPGRCGSKKPKRRPSGSAHGKRMPSGAR